MTSSLPRRRKPRQSKAHGVTPSMPDNARGASSSGEIETMIIFSMAGPEKS